MSVRSPIGRALFEALEDLLKLGARVTITPAFVDVTTLVKVVRNQMQGRHSAEQFHKKL